MLGELQINEDEPCTVSVVFIIRSICISLKYNFNNNLLQIKKVKLHTIEAAHVLQELMSGMGLDYETDKQYNALICGATSNLNFEVFLELLQFKDYDLLSIEHMASLNEVIEEMYQTYIHDIIKKGYLLRRGYLLPSLKEYWFVLQPCELTFYKHQNQRDLCGSIALDQNCMVRPSQTSALAIGKQEKFLKFILSAGERTFELAAQNHKSRLQWITALQLGITYSMGKEGYQRELVARRRRKRDAAYLQKQQEEMVRSKHFHEAEKTKILLEDEKIARIAAESQTRALQIIAREDSRRVAELEDIKITLENLLHEETQAKRDEEIVRALQARVLAEEWEKRDELEQLQDEQRTLLEQERDKRMQFEIMQKEKEQNLREAERKLKELEDERQRLDLELKQARIKILHSEETKQLLESRLQIISPPKDGERIRRALSFMHPNRERGATTMGIEVRAAFSNFKSRKSDDK